MVYTFFMRNKIFFVVTFLLLGIVLSFLQFEKSKEASLNDATNLPVYFQEKIQKECMVSSKWFLVQRVKECVSQIHQMSHNSIVYHNVVREDGTIGDELILKEEDVSREKHAEQQRLEIKQQQEEEIAEKRRQNDAKLQAERDDVIQKSKMKGWILLDGDPLESCTRPLFGGNATIRGWYVWDTFYVQKEWMFHIADKDISKLPFDMFRFDAPINVRLTDISYSLEEKLKRSSKEKPVEVTIDQVLFYCEGAPVFHVAQKNK